MAIDMGVKGILFVAHIGKFVKVAAGIMNTHSHNADGRMEVLLQVPSVQGLIWNVPERSWNARLQMRRYCSWTAMVS